MTTPSSVLKLTERVVWAADSRHEHRSSRVGDAASGRGRGVLVVSQGATQQAQVVEGQHQDHHAAKSNAADPPVSSRQR